MNRDTDALQSLPKSGPPPTSRLKDAASARDVVQRLWDAGENRRKSWNQVDQMADGFPPYDRGALQRAGQSGRSNTPSMDGAAILSSANTTFYNLANSTRSIWEIDLEDVKDRSKRAAASRIVTECVDRRIKGWSNFYFRWWSMISDFVRQGRGYLFWDAGGDWKFRNIRYHRVLVPDGTEIDLDTVDRIVVLQDFTVTQLWGKVRDEKSASARGWNVSAVREAIQRAVPPRRDTADDVIDVTQGLKDNDMWIDAQASRIRAANVFVREFSGKWSHYLIEREEEGDFLFKRRDAFSSVQNFCSPFFFEPLDGSWNGAYGLGKTIYPIIKHGDRMLNSLLDAVYLRTGLNLQARDASSLRRLSSVQIGGGVNVLPPGLDVIAANMLGDLQGALSVDQLFTNRLERNTGIYRTNLGNEKGNPKTAEEIRRRWSQSAVLETSAVDRWYTQQDRVGVEIWRRMKNDREIVAELLEELRDGGIDITAAELKGEAVVTSVRAVGNGSQLARQDAIWGTQPLVGSLPEAGKQNWIDDAIAAQAGQAKVERWNPKPPERDAMSEQVWEAQLENGALTSGAPVMRYPEQNDLVHADTHLKLMASAVQSLQGGAPPAKVLHVLQSIGPHVAMHLQALSADNLRKSEFEALSAAWKRFSSIADKLQQQLVQEMKAKAAQDAQNPTPSEAQTDMMERDAKLQMDQQERAARLQMDQANMAARLQMDREKMQNDIQIATVKAQSDIEIRRAQAQMNLAEDAATKG